MTEERPLASDDDRNVGVGVAIVLFGALCAAACTLIYLSAAFMDRSSDRAAWQLWLGVSAGLALGSTAAGVIVATVRRRTAKMWAIPAVLFAVPTLVMFEASIAKVEPPPADPPAFDFPLNDVTDGG